jgi:drug/metabolite transporter (DMT)-like permease
MSKLIGIPRSVLLTAASVVFVLSWSSGFLIAKAGTAETHPITFVLWRFILVAGLLAAGALFLAARRRLRMPSWRDIRPHLLIGLFAQFGYVVPIYLAVAAGVSSGTTALIDAVQPLVVATLVGPLLGLRVRALQWLGLALGAAGVVMIVWSDAAAAASPTPAYLLPLAALACLVTATFLERRTSSTLRVFPTLAVHSAVSLVAITIVAVATNTWAPPAEPSFWFATALTALIPSLLAYALYWALLRHLGITGLNALLFLVAPATSVLGALTFGEPFTIATAAGLLLGAAAITLVLLPPRRRSAPESPASSAAAAPHPTRQPSPPSRQRSNSSAQR